MLGQGFPIDDYDALTAPEILQALPRLSAAELAVVAAHERQHKARVTILRRLDRLAASQPDEVVIDLREDPGGTCLLCDEHVATSDAFIAHLKQAHGLTDDPGFQSSLPAKLFAPAESAEAPPEPSSWRSPVLDRVIASAPKPIRERPPVVTPPVIAEADAPHVTRAGPVVDPYEPPALRLDQVAMTRRPVPGWRQVAGSSWLWLVAFAVVFVLVIAGILVVIG